MKALFLRAGGNGAFAWHLDMKKTNPEERQQDIEALVRLTNYPEWQILQKYAAVLSVRKQKPTLNVAAFDKFKAQAPEQFKANMVGIIEYCQGINDLLYLPERLARGDMAYWNPEAQKEKEDAGTRKPKR